MPIPYGRQTIDDDDVRAVAEALRGDWLTQGPTVAAFEEAVAATCDAPYAVAFSSGTAALHGAAFAAGLGPGDELVTSAITFAASANCGAYLGATPRFADIDAETWNVSPETISREVTSRTKAVVPVHFTGLPAPSKELRASLPDDVLVIEDAAHALGARTPDEAIGSCRYSDMAVFSFHPVKAVTTAEGGVVTTRERKFYDALKLFRSHGLTKDPALLVESEGPWHQEQHILGFNYRLTDVQSALGLSQLPKLHGFITRRNAVASRYREALADVESLELPPAARPGSLHAYHLFVVRHKGGEVARRRIYERLHERGILVQVHYRPVYLHPFYAQTFGYERGLCPAAEHFYSGCISLPCYPTLTEEDQQEVIAALRAAVRELAP